MMISGHVFEVAVDTAQQVHASTCKAIRADAVTTRLQMYSFIFGFKMCFDQYLGKFHLLFLLRF